MKKPSHTLNVFIFLFLFIFCMSLTVVFIIFYGFVKISDPTTGNVYTPFLYNQDELLEVPLAALMNSLISFALFLQVFTFILAIALYSSNKMKKKNTASILVFLFYFIIVFLIFIDYSISYTFGLQLSSNSDWIPQDNPDLVNKYIAYFTLANSFQYTYFLDPYSIVVVNLACLFLGAICIIIVSSKIRNYNLYSKNGNQQSSAAKSTVIINNPPGNNPNNNQQTSFQQNKREPIIINNTPPVNPYNNIQNLLQQTRREPIIINNPAQNQNQQTRREPIIINNPAQNQNQQTRREPIIINNPTPINHYTNVGNTESSNRREPIIINNPAQNQNQQNKRESIIINNSPHNTNSSSIRREPINIQNSPNNTNSSSNRREPININNSAQNWDSPNRRSPVVIKNPLIDDRNNYLSNYNENINIGYPTFQKKKYVPIDNRSRQKLIYNNILINKILKEPSNYLSDAKILINRLPNINNENDKDYLLKSIYKACLNNNYLNIELQRAIYEKLGSRLPIEFEKKNTQKSINYLLIYNKDGFKNLMYNLISSM